MSAQAVDPAGLLEPDQVWEHRHECRICRAGDVAHRHAYLIVRVVSAELVTVRDLTFDGRPHGQVYGKSAAQFGSLGRGGLRLCGRIRHGQLERLPDDQIDHRIIHHPRLGGGRRLTRTIPGTKGGSGAGLHVGRRDRQEAA